MKKNIQFNYLYRDAGNYKNHGSVVFSNPAILSLEEIDKTIRERLIEGVWFLHEEFGVPPLFFNDHDVNGEDHGWHEYVGVEYTSEQCTNVKTLMFSKIIQAENR